MSYLRKYPVKDGKPWFHDLEKTATDNYLRYIIPINEEQGVIMYYSDLYVADMWRNWSNVSDDILIQMIHKELHSLYPSKDIFHYQLKYKHVIGKRVSMHGDLILILKPCQEK